MHAISGDSLSLLSPARINYIFAFRNTECGSCGGKARSVRRRISISNNSSKIGNSSIGYPHSDAFSRTLRIALRVCVSTFARHGLSTGGAAPTVAAFISGVAGAAAADCERQWSSNVLHLILVHRSRLSPKRSCTVPSANFLLYTPRKVCKGMENRHNARPRAMMNHTISKKMATRHDLDETILHELTRPLLLCLINTQCIFDKTCFCILCQTVSHDANLFQRKFPKAPFFSRLASAELVLFYFTRKPRFAQQERQHPLRPLQLEQPCGCLSNRSFSDNFFKPVTADAAGGGPFLAALLPTAEASRLLTDLLPPAVAGRFFATEIED